MMLTIVILCLFFIAVINGYRKGLVRTVFRFAGIIIIWTVAVMLSHNIGKFLKDHLLWSIGSNWSSPVNSSLVNKSNDFLYSGIGFSLITLIGFYIFNRIQRSLKFINKIPLLGIINRLLGAVINFIIMYLCVFFFLYVVGSLDINWLHEQIVYSNLSQFIMQRTPFLSRKIYEWFLLI